MGAGNEYALGFMPGFSGRPSVVFLKFDVRNKSLYVTATGARAFTFAEDAKKYTHTVRSELVYHFNWGGSAVVAKY